MKSNLLLLMLLIGSMCFAQAPTDYYAYYPFTNGSLVNQANPGTGDIANGNFSWTTDRFGNAVSAMDCENVRSDGFSNSNAMNEFAVSFWVKMDVLPNSSTTGTQRVIDFYENAANGDYVFFNRTAPDDFEIVYQINGQTASRVFQSAALEAGQWCHVVLQSKRIVHGSNVIDNLLEFFFNGNFEISISSDLNLYNSGDAFANGANFSISRASNFPGLVDDIQLFDRALNNQEVSDIYNGASCTGIINIPDTNFKAELLAIPSLNSNGNNEIECFEANGFDGQINVSNRNIADLTGIEAFTNLLALNCSGNQLTSIDLSANSSLVNITCNNMPTLTYLNVANGVNGVGYFGTVTYANLLDATANPNLSCIQHDAGFNPTNNSNWYKDATASWSTNCPTTPCTSIVNIPDANFKNALLDHGIGVTGAGISVIDTDGDGEICATEATTYTGTISVSSQSISDLTGIEAFINIQELKCHSNNLTSIDISVNTSLSWFSADNNQLTSVNLANGNNSTTLSVVNVSNNTNLSCIQHDTGFDPTTNNNWTKDASASWSDNCPAAACTSIVNIPNANFKNALLAHGTTITGAGISVIDTDGDGEICTTEAQAYTGAISVVAKNISNLSGIEAFVNITNLDCGFNQLNAVDVSANTLLNYLDVTSNNLTSIDVSSNTALVNFLCESNGLTSLDISGNTSITYLNCQGNQLTNLNVANGNNANMTLSANNNNSLTCIQHDTGFDPTTNNNWTKDASASWSTNCSASSCTSIVNIPDTNFKNALLAHGTTITGTGISVIDTDGDGEICSSEAQAYSGSINVYGFNLTNLTGIEAFTNITKLNCGNNQLASLNVSANTALTELNCSYNQFTNLNVSANTALTELDCSGSQLTSLNVSANTALTELNCSENQLASLNVSANTALIELRCHSNNLTSIDISANTSLSWFAADNNQLTSANLANGNNSTTLSVVNVSNNTNLTCIQHDTGFDPTTNNNWTKDASASWSINCAPCASIVNIPDANFKNALLDHGVGTTGAGISVIDTDGDGEICDVEAQVYTGTIDVPFKNISDLTGIEAFTNASILYVNNNQLTSLDVSNNLSLETIYFSDNSITQADLSLNTLLTRIYANNNQLTSLNVANGNNSNINAMRAQGNPNLTCIQHDTGFDPTTNSNWLRDATASWSTNCSASACTSIVNIPDANFKAALLAQGTTITGPSISVVDTDGDGEICTTEATAYTGTINVSSYNISDLTGIQAFTALTVLRCHDNSSLTSLDVSQNTALIRLDCYSNNLTSLDVSQNTALTELLCGSNSLTSLDISQNTALTGLYCMNNSLTSLDVSQNTALTELYCYNNSLTSLNVANGYNGNMTYMQAQNNPNLTCIQHDMGFDPTTAGNWAKDASASWNTNCNLSVNDEIFNSGVQIYPNPATTILTISSEIVTIKNVEVYNVLGSKIIDTNTLNINVSNLTKGIYIAKIKSNDNRLAIKKFVKQ